MIPVTILYDARIDNTYKMKDVGSGAGKLVGGSIAGFPGMVAGHYVGKDYPKNPEAPADITRAGHRFAINADRRLSMKQLKASGLGAVIGAGTGRLLAAGDDMPPEAKAMAGLGGAALGSTAGFLGSSAKAGYRAGKKMGYGAFGRTMNAVTPFAALSTPEALRQKMTQGRRPATAAA